MLGAQEFGIGTASLIAMGCIMVRQCQSNTCPVGVCTQDPVLRAKFTGTADKVVNLMSFYAQEVREVLASVGARSIDEVIGRADLLTQVSRGAEHLDDLDLNPLLINVDQGEPISYDRKKPRNPVPDTLDAQVVTDAEPFFKDGEKMQLSYAVQNTLRSIGTRVSSHIVQRFGMKNGLQPDHLTIKLAGSAGQSLGAFAAPGLKIEVMGEANDYVGKGLSRRHHRGAAAARLAAGAARERDHRQHRALRRDRRLALRQRPGRRAVLRAQLRRRGGGRGLRLERLRVHDRRRGGDPRAVRRQLRRRHDRRHGLSLRSRTARSGCG